MPFAGTSSSGITRTFAVGKPSVPPRASPPTTIPSTSGGRPRSGAARSTSPPRRSSRMSVDDGVAADRAQEALREFACLQRGELRREIDDESLGDAGRRDQLEPALERRQELDAV